MKKLFTIAAVSALGVTVLGTLSVFRAAAQDPILTPIIVSEVEPIIVKALTPKPKPTTTQKFQGYVMHANAAQVTVRAMGNDMGIQTFPLSPEVAAQMQKIIDKGGYQYGDKVTVYYDPQSHTAIKLKGKPSRPL
jgi:hypothetical protein